jgi:hypothetical protein
MCDASATRCVAVSLPVPTRPLGTAGSGSTGSSTACTTSERRGARGGHQQNDGEAVQEAGAQLDKGMAPSTTEVLVQVQSAKNRDAERDAASGGFVPGQKARHAAP